MKTPSTIKACCPPTGHCVDACTQDSCAAGERCDDTGGCVPASCDDGYACAADQRCFSAASYADDHGCVPLRCTDGYVCPPGTRCINSLAGDDHGCGTDPCDGTQDPYQCPAGTHCDPRSGADVHHCRVWCSDTGCPVNQICNATESCEMKPCSADADCDCGYCVVGRCWANLGVCNYQGTGGTGG